MTIKKITLIIFITIASHFCIAQTGVEISYSDSSSLSINGLVISNTTGVNELTKKLGEPSKIIDYPNKEQSLLYENYGLVLMTRNQLLEGIGINYNWDGDKKFPSTSYSGHCIIGERFITKETVQKDITSISKIGFGCPMDILCASSSKYAKVRCTIAFNTGSNLISQIVFLLK